MYPKGYIILINKQYYTLRGIKLICKILSTFIIVQYIALTESNMGRIPILKAGATLYKLHIQNDTV